uniref:Uncharacterized protein n=1 Tax=Anopheles atroparvus TaxID=41427 RepID=A0A182J5M0_ANOAO
MQGNHFQREEGKNLSNDWLEKTHMLSAPHGQPVQAKVPNHVRYGRERAAELSEDELAGIGVPLYPHVHKTFGAPETRGNAIEGPESELCELSDDEWRESELEVLRLPSLVLDLSDSMLPPLLDVAMLSVEEKFRPRCWWLPAGTAAAGLVEGVLLVADLVRFESSRLLRPWLAETILLALLLLLLVSCKSTLWFVMRSTSSRSSSERVIFESKAVS